MRETGEVIAAEGGSVTVRMKRTSACASCGACRISSDEKEMLVVAKNECAAGVHDIVRVELRAEAFLTAALILYGFPLAGLLAGFVLGNWIGNFFALGQNAALAGFVGGVVLAGLAYAVIRKLEPVWRTKGYTPVAAGILSDSERGRA